MFRRRRCTARNHTKALGAELVQAVLDDEDAGYSMSAATVDYDPEDESAMVRGRLTVSPAKSRIYWRFGLGMPTFVAAVVETADMLDKAIAAEPQEELFPQLAVPETDLTNVRGAYDVTITDPDEQFDADADEELTERVAVLRGAVLDVRGRPGSASFVLVVGHEGAEVGKLSIKLEPAGDGFGDSGRHRR